MDVSNPIKIHMQHLCTKLAIHMYRDDHTMDSLVVGSHMKQ